MTDDSNFGIRDQKSGGGRGIRTLGTVLRWRKRLCTSKPLGIWIGYGSESSPPGGTGDAGGGWLVESSTF